MDRKHIKFSVDAQEYQKLLKEENEELKEKIICLESDACNEVSQAQFDDAMEDKDIEIKKLKEIIIGLGPQGSYLISAEAEVKKLQEENESLKKDIKDIQEIWVKSRDYGNQMFVENEKLKKEIVEYESVEQSLMKCVREGGGYDEMLPIHYRQESESDDE